MGVGAIIVVRLILGIVIFGSGSGDASVSYNLF